MFFSKQAGAGWKKRGTKAARRSASQIRRRTFLPGWEAMEDRTLLSTMDWINAVGGDWDVASNWVNSTNPSDQHVPTSSDDAVIDISGITVTHSSNTADSVNSLTVSSSDTTLPMPWRP
jgi:hypothetical protein